MTQGSNSSKTTGWHWRSRINSTTLCKWPTGSFACFLPGRQWAVTNFGKTQESGKNLRFTRVQVYFPSLLSLAKTAANRQSPTLTWAGAFSRSFVSRQNQWPTNHLLVMSGFQPYYVSFIFSLRLRTEYFNKATTKLRHSYVSLHNRPSGGWGWGAIEVCGAPSKTPRE